MVSILNAMGQVVYQSSVNNQQSTIDISNLAGGIYFAQLSSTGKIKTVKFIIAEK